LQKTFDDEHNREGRGQGQDDRRLDSISPLRFPQVADFLNGKKTLRTHIVTVTVTQ
jgi:hypothetical protein